MSDVSKEAVLSAAQCFIDHYFDNPNTKRPVITIPAKESNSDLMLTRGIQALAAERDGLKAEVERLRKKDEVISGLLHLSLILQDPSDSRFAEAVNLAERISEHMKGVSHD